MNKWTFGLFAAVLLYTATRINFPEHWSYWGPADASLLESIRLSAGGSASLFSQWLLSKVALLSDEPLHLGRFVMIVWVLTSAFAWFLSLTKRFSGKAAWLAVAAALVSQGLLSQIDSLGHQGFELGLFFLLPALVTWVTMHTGTRRALGLATLLLVTFLGAVNSPRWVAFAFPFLAFALTRAKPAAAFSLLATFAGLGLNLWLARPEALSPFPAALIPYPQVVQNLIREFGPLLLLLGAALLVTQKWNKKVALPEDFPRMFRALAAGGISYEVFTYIFAREEVFLATALYPFGAYLVAAGIDQVLPRIPRLAASSLALLVAAKLMPNLGYLAKYPHSIQSTAVWNQPSGISADDYELMKVSADWLKEESTPQDHWLVPGRFGWNEETAHPFLRFWSQRPIASDGKHLSQFLKRVEEEKKTLAAERTTGQLFVLYSSFVTEGDVRHYLEENWKMVKEQSTVFGNLRIYSSSPAAEQKLTAR